MVFQIAQMCVYCLTFFYIVYIICCVGFQFVTCGTVLKLIHIDTNIRLHSHDVKYGSGSGQQVSGCTTACCSQYVLGTQSVTGVTSADDVNSYWVVKAQHKGQCIRGLVCMCHDMTISHVLSTFPVCLLV